MIDTIEIRPLVRGDIPALKHILDGTKLFPPELLDEMAEPFLSGQAPHFWLVAEKEDVLGFAYTEPERMAEGAYNLLAIAVRPDSQGMGVGKALVTALAQLLREQGARILLVETSSLDNYVRTREFYAAQAFTREARIRDFYTDGEDKIVFWKRL